MKFLRKNLYKTILFFVILYILIDLSIPFVSFNYPYALTLSDGNIFVIHQKGVTICNKHLTRILKNVITFPEDEEINTEASLSKITTAFQYGYIISIINDKIYIFDEYGTSIYIGTEKILSSGETAEYYTLVPIKNETDYIHYIIGYVHNSLLYFLYYKYNYSNKTNNLSTYLKEKMHDEYDASGYLRSFYIENKGLSCQYMKNNRAINVLVCIFLTVYNSKYYITIDFLLPEESGINRHTNFLPKYYLISYNIKCIKTVLSPDFSKALVGMYASNGIAYFFIYDINSQIEYDLLYFTDSYCRNQYHGLKFNY